MIYKLTNDMFIFECLVLEVDLFGVADWGELILFY